MPFCSESTEGALCSLDWCIQLFVKGKVAACIGSKPFWLFYLLSLLMPVISLSKKSWNQKWHSQHGDPICSVIFFGLYLIFYSKVLSQSDEKRLSHPMGTSWEGYDDDDYYYNDAT